MSQSDKERADLFLSILKVTVLFVTAAGVGVGMMCWWYVHDTLLTCGAALAMIGTLSAIQFPRIALAMIPPPKSE